MSKHLPNKYLPLMLAGLLASAQAGEAMAQDVSKSGQKRSSSSKTMEEANKRVTDQTKRLDKKRELDGSIPTGAQLTLEQAEDEARKMSAEQIEALKRQLEAKNAQMIAKLDTIIANDPYNVQKPQWMFQKAELLWELRNMEYLRTRAVYNQCLSAAGQGTAGESGCKEPLPDYREAQLIYEDILRQYPDYQRLDEVIYRLGRGLIEAGQGVQAVAHLQRLVQNYPNSKYVPEAHLALGEFYFDPQRQMFHAARENYLKVLQYKNFPLYDFALYKLAWVQFNQQEFRESADTFKQVVERTNNKLGFQRQAINDLVAAFAALENGWKEGREYFTKQRDREFAFQKVGQIANLYEAQGKDDKAIEIYEWFIEERKDHASIPTWMESIIVSRKKLNDFNALETTMNRFVAYINPKGSWAAANKDNEGALSNASLLTEASLAFLANHYHRQAQRLDSQKDYQTAAKYYHEFIAAFPTSAASFDMTFFLGEIYLYSIKDFEKAAAQYQKVVDLYKGGNVPKDAKPEDVEAIVKDSAFAIVSSYNELVKKNHPDSILVKMAEIEEKSPGKATKTADKAAPVVEAPPIPKTDLLKFELGFVQASDQFAAMYPKEDVTPTVDYVAAEVYKSRGHYDSCIPRYENIITYAPKHRYASYAGNSLLEANYRLKKWDEVEKWARHLYANKIFDVTPPESLQGSIAYAINERAKIWQTEKKFDQAAEELLRLAEEFPKSTLAPGAMFNAASIYENGDRINKAIEVFERVVATYPDHERAPEAIFAMGDIFLARADFERAANYFERLGTPKYKDSPRSADAVFNAAQVRKAMLQWDKAISTYEQYIKLFPTREDILTVEFQLGYLEKERKAWDKAAKRFADFAKKATTTPSQQVEINFELGVLAEKTQAKGWEKTADGYYTKSLDIWKGLPEAEKAKTNYFASAARFAQAEVVYGQFTRMKLVAGKDLGKTLTAKAEMQQKAEGIYLQIIEMKSPRWVAASAYRVGQLYNNFSDELYAVPMPEGLPPEVEDQYRMMLDDAAMPLGEKALMAFRSALRLALEYKAYNEWSSLSAKEISRMEKEAFPITGQEGVSTEHGRLNFFAPAPIKDMELAVERAAKRLERTRPKVEPPAQESAPSAPAGS